MKHQGPTTSDGRLAEGIMAAWLLHISGGPTTSARCALCCAPVVCWVGPGPGATCTTAAVTWRVAWGLHTWSSFAWH